ncbi:OmpA family protein [Roseivirga pacifica]
MKKTFLLLALSLFSIGLSAQTKDSPWWLAVDGVSNKFDFSYYDGLFDFSENTLGIRVAAERYLNSSFDLDLGVSYGALKHEDVFDGAVADLTTRIYYKFNNGYFLKEESRFAPYLFAGIGLTSYSKVEPFYEEYNDGVYATTPFGLGFRFLVSENFEINTKAAFNKSISYAPNYMQYGIGVSFALSRNKDKDGDGVPNKEDNCPDEAGPAENNGCPWPDTDGDGVIDKDDACPTVKGNSASGCPDADGDGVPDDKDECPQLAGSLNGCPDADGDGVKDSEDECPNTAGSLNGCPDRDGDGVKDSEDKCPSVAGGANGCPDSDGDGVLDNEDNCPNTAGTINGCPSPAEKADEVLKLASGQIKFALSSDELNATAKAALDKVAALLKQTSLKLRIDGYADSTGPEEFNTWISKQRASAVKDYLQSKGVDASRLEVSPMGESNPLADNSTSNGRALNRRVEFKVLN